MVGFIACGLIILAYVGWLVAELHVKQFPLNDLRDEIKEEE